MGVGTVSASLETIPGDGLYPVKTAVEQTRLALSLNEQDRAETHLWIASSRVDELSKIAATGKVELASKVVAEYEHNVAQALQLAAVQSQEEAQFQSRVSVVHTNLQAVYETAPETLQTLLASTLTLTENPADNQPATSATGATPTGPVATNAHGQPSSGITAAARQGQRNTGYLRIHQGWPTFSTANSWGSLPVSIQGRAAIHHWAHSEQRNFRHRPSPEHRR